MQVPGGVFWFSAEGAASAKAPNQGYAGLLRSRDNTEAPGAGAGLRGTSERRGQEQVHEEPSVGHLKNLTFHLATSQWI